MNDEQSRRLSLAADAVLKASRALEEAREAVAGTRSETTQDRERQQAAGRAAARLEAAARRIEDALHRGAVAAATLGRTGAYPRYQGALQSLREGRETARSLRQPGVAALERSEDALARIEAALNTAAALTFGDDQ
jgi:hypothetical protein